MYIISRSYIYNIRRCNNNIKMILEMTKESQQEIVASIAFIDIILLLLITIYSKAISYAVVYSLML